MVVDGVTEFVGNDMRRARTAILSASRSRKAEARLDWSGDIHIRIARCPEAQQKADVYISITENGLSTTVARGENGGRVLHHDGVVRMWRRAGVWNPETDFTTVQKVDLQPSWNARNLTAVLFAQERDSRRIIAAASMKASGS
jgi:hypothetical protein